MHGIGPGVLFPPRCLAIAVEASLTCSTPTSRIFLSDSESRFQKESPPYGAASRHSMSLTTPCLHILPTSLVSASVHRVSASALSSKKSDFGVKPENGCNPRGQVAQRSRAWVFRWRLPHWNCPGLIPFEHKWKSS